MYAREFLCRALLNKPSSSVGWASYLLRTAHGREVIYAPEDLRTIRWSEELPESSGARALSGPELFA